MLTFGPIIPSHPLPCRACTQVSENRETGAVHVGDVAEIQEDDVMAGLESLVQGCLQSTARAAVYSPIGHKHGNVS